MDLALEGPAWKISRKQGGEEMGLGGLGAALPLPLPAPSHQILPPQASLS